MNHGDVTSVKISWGITSEFPITIGLYQGLTLSPNNFALMTDELKRSIQYEAPWCMLFVEI